MTFMLFKHFNTIFVSSHVYQENPERTQIGSMNIEHRRIWYIYPNLPGLESAIYFVTSEPRPHQCLPSLWPNHFRCFPKLPWISKNRLSGFDITFGYLLIDRKPMRFWKFQGDQARAIALRRLRHVRYKFRLIKHHIILSKLIISQTNCKITW